MFELQKIVHMKLSDMNLWYVVYVIENTHKNLIIYAHPSIN